jgi:hypothetical protein
MKPARFDWVAFNNEDWPFAIGIKFADGSAFDWSQYSSIAMQLKVDPLQPEPELTLALGSGLTVRSADHSVLDGLVERADVETFVGIYTYDIVGINAGDPIVVVTGTIAVGQGVTR